MGRAFEELLLPGHALDIYRTTWRRWPLSESAEDAFARSRWLEQATDAIPATRYSLFVYAEKLRGAGA